MLFNIKLCKYNRKKKERERERVFDISIVLIMSLKEGCKSISCFMMYAYGKEFIVSPVKCIILKASAVVNLKG